MKLKDPRECIELLMDRGLTQADIAKHAGVSQPTIARFYNRVHDGIDYRVADKLRMLAALEEQS